MNMTCSLEKRQDNEGSTLAEVIIAILLLSIVIVSGLGILTSTIKLNARTKERDLLLESTTNAIDEFMVFGSRINLDDLSVAVQNNNYNNLSNSFKQELKYSNYGIDYTYEFLNKYELKQADKNNEYYEYQSNPGNGVVVDVTIKGRELTVKSTRKDQYYEAKNWIPEKNEVPFEAPN